MSPDPRCESVAIIGAGIIGLITAHILLEDGFTDVQVLTRDNEVGGIWARSRIYPGLYTNVAYGEFRYSSLKMAPPSLEECPDGRLPGQHLCEYFNAFASRFLKGRVQFGKEVQRIRRNAVGGGWKMDVQDGSSLPKMPDALTPEAAYASGFKGLVMHTAEFAAKMDQLLSAVPLDAPSVVVVGGGKSAQDMCAFLANQGRKVTMVCRNLDYLIASIRPLPKWLRNSRFLALIWGHIHLRTFLERFLHTTWIGGLIVRFLWYILVEYAVSPPSHSHFETNDDCNLASAAQFLAAGVPRASPLRNVTSPFWSVRVNDEGVPRPNGFHKLAVAGKIDVITPATVAGFSEDGESIVLNDGRVLRASALVLGTGYKSSWDNLFDEATLDELGIGPQPAQLNCTDHWDYTSLYNPPPLHPDAKRWSSAIYRGIVPAKNILRSDLAVSGTGISVNNGYSGEVTAHWISSYFLRDPMRLPGSIEEALVATEREAAWLKRRYPQIPTALNGSYTAILPFLAWPQYVDDLLEDMGLAGMRSGGNVLTWPFKLIDADELKTLKQERDARRAAAKAKIA
ncbi:FAD/NAD-P-binding domain-containing protein [Trametes coccinea BRFM310]|uniref:FAD/NAD-P-binding domain-containing protein n=1 Tax=Trametes coccinea (strain BRFM310) TaxID=1353009 RepID=A0A1Y2IUX4_TRAC3|nr:FAD/NAD-P-binding domain-containing protein [Trametes coccinea BRFM310]